MIRKTIHFVDRKRRKNKSTAMLYTYERTTYSLLFIPFYISDKLRHWDKVLRHWDKVE